ncbi:hypothetical protein ACRALDRAFT_2022502 [Sodiomyces alcalophilus JCM 7366]|uniref:uncharacterized protein n=1 Tax=Sodiomyces alcalophilus JCM 7366 TaxID=591952 RepID=UPI0039B5996C
MRHYQAGGYPYKCNVVQEASDTEARSLKEAWENSVHHWRRAANPPNFLQYIHYMLFSVTSRSRRQGMRI